MLTPHNLLSNFQTKRAHFEPKGPKEDLHIPFILPGKPPSDQIFLLEFKPKFLENLNSLSPLKSTLGRFEAL